MNPFNEEVIINDNLQVNGSSNEVQVIVKGYSGQSEALQQWQDSSASILAEIDADGHLLVGDQDATIDSLIESHNLDDANKPARGFHAKGSLTGALSNLVSWVVQELVLKGNGGISALHRALRVQATNENTGAMETGADVRAGDFEVINSGGNDTINHLEMSALRARVTNQSTKYLDKAYGLKVEITDDGNANEVYAIHTDNGVVHLGDLLELVELSPATNPPSGTVWIYPKSDGNLYARFHDGSSGDEKNLSGGAPTSHTHTLADITDRGDLAALDTVDTAEIEDGAVTKAKLNANTDMTGASSSVNGTRGTVPQPVAGDDEKYLRGDGTWADIAGGSGGTAFDQTITTTYSLASGKQVVLAMLEIDSQFTNDGLVLIA